MAMLAFGGFGVAWGGGGGTCLCDLKHVSGPCDVMMAVAWLGV